MTFTCTLFMSFIINIDSTVILLHWVSLCIVSFVSVLLVYFDTVLYSKNVNREVINSTG